MVMALNLLRITKSLLCGAFFIASTDASQPPQRGRAASTPSVPAKTNSPQPPRAPLDQRKPQGASPVLQRSRAPSTTLVPSTVIYKICDKKNKNIVSQVAFDKTMIELSQKTGCLDDNKINNDLRTPILEFRQKLNNEAEAIKNNINRQLEGLSSDDRGTAEELIRFLQETTDYSYFFKSAKNNLIPQIDGESIKFLWSLCSSVYYDNRQKESSQYGSTRYDKKIGGLNTERQTAVEHVEVLEGLRTKLKEITLDQSISVNTIKRKIKESPSNAPFSPGGKSQQKTAVASKTVQSNAGEALAAAIQTLRDSFKQNQLNDDTPYVKVVDTINQLAAPSKAKITELDTQINLLSDRILKDFWIKLDANFHEKALKFEPIMALYRSTRPGPKVWEIFDGLIAAKQNPKSRIDDKKELSGVILYHRGTEQNKPDELIFAFSGSNSSEDWKTNLDFFEKEGTSPFNLLAGLEGHSGFINSYGNTLNHTMARLKGWFTNNYSDSTERPKDLVITFTGHSLGAALAQVGAVWAAQNLVPFLKTLGITARVKIVSFAAPPVFSLDSARIIEKSLIKPHDDLRIYVERDPVSTLGLSKGIKRDERSLLMFVSSRAHIGIPVGLAGSMKGESVGKKLDIINRWQYHGADRYNNLIEIYTRTEAFKDITANIVSFFDDNLMKNIIKWRASNEIQDYLKKLPTQAQPAYKQYGISIDELEAIAQGKDIRATKPEKLTLEQYESAAKYTDVIGQPKGAKIAIAETKGVTISVEGKKFAIGRSTSCDPQSLLKSEVKSSLIDAGKVSCSCCVAKNVFVSQDASITARFRKLIGKKISTLESIADHCSKYCAPLRATKKRDEQVSYMESLMHEAGLGDLWNKKQFTFKD